ncbi:MAG: NADP-dependent malic enzyme [Candidatus Vogelbacteria bacterium]|nr:NADP-dependent malic enzyme [Candidatus Vogelbacteria bacterium]
MKDYYKKSLALHKKNGGKIGTLTKVLLRNRDELSLAYTPGVAAVSIEIGKDSKKAFEYTLKKNTVAIVTDGSAILGLGNLGPYAAIPVMEGKAAILKEFANVDAFPICLDTQDAEEIIKAVKQIAPVFGAINLEDISAPRCFEIENRLRKELLIPVMHDDQHGTATVVLAGLINSIKLRKLKKEDAKIVLNGAGAAGTAVAELLLKYGFKNIIVCDSHGAVYDGRADLNSDKVELAKKTNLNKVKGGLSDVLIGVHIFIGVSKAGLMALDMVRSMAKNPIIFALANPVPEIMPELAKSAGAFIVATGRSDFGNQLNNSLGFPGLFRGALDHHIKQFDDQIFIRAAKAIASFVKKPTTEKILPTQFEKGLVRAVAQAVRE